MKRVSLHCPILQLSATDEKHIPLAFPQLNNACVDDV